jgi:hypothetical protein
MSAAPPQSFANHTKIVPGYHYAVFGVLGINLLWSLVRLWRLPGWESVLSLATAAALLGVTLYARLFALRVQDRVIRLEMRLRLRELLPSDLQPRIAELAPRHLVALRFASDAEIEALVRRVLAGELVAGKSIKQNIRDWQPDHLRC